MAKPTPDILQELIKGIWTDHKTRGDELMALQVLGLAKTKLEELKLQNPKEWENIQLPQKRKANYLIKEAKETYLDLSKKLRDKIEKMAKPWSLAALNDRDIPREALPMVLRVWKLCQLREQVFTIRQAKWAAWLSSALGDALALMVLSGFYANRELACLILKKPLETADVDLVWTTPPWELATAYLVGVAKPPETGFYKLDESSPFTMRPIPTTAPPSIIGSGVVEIEPSFLHFQAKVAEFKFLYGLNELKEREVFKAISAERGWLLQQGWFGDEQWKKQWVEDPSYQKFVKTWKPVLTVAALETLGLSQEAVRVYTLWLGYLAKGQRMVPLENLNPVGLRKQVLDRLDTLLQLRDWVKNHKLASGSEELSTPPWPLIQPLDLVVALFGLKPIDILRKVGYEN